MPWPRALAVPIVRIVQQQTGRRQLVHLRKALHDVFSKNDISGRRRKLSPVPLHARRRLEGLARANRKLVTSNRHQRTSECFTPLRPLPFVFAFFHLRLPTVGPYEQRTHTHSFGALGAIRAGSICYWASKSANHQQYNSIATTPPAGLRPHDSNMKYFLGAAALLAATANAQEACTNVDNNSYCKLVDAMYVDAPGFLPRCSC